MLNVTLAIPTLDHVPGEAFYSHMAMVMKMGRTARIAIPPAFNMLPHDRARAYLFDLAIRNQSDYIFFVDDDMIIPDDAYCQLLEVFSYRRPKPCAVSGHYYRRGFDYTCVWSLSDERIPGGLGRVDADSGIHQITWSGLGCCLIDVKWVKENLEPPYFTMKIGERSTEVTDDTSFFDKVKEKNGIVYGHADVRCGHLGSRSVICDRTVDSMRRIELEVRESIEQEKR